MLLSALVLMAATQKPVEMTLQRVAVTMPDADHAELVLHAPGHDPVAPLRGQRLKVGDAEVPVQERPSVTLSPQGCTVGLTVDLAAVPEAILDLDPYQVPVCWEGLDRKGRTVLVLKGAINLADRGQVELPEKKMVELYASLADYSATPEGTTVHVRVLLSLYNPFAFEVVATGLEYRLTVGEVKVISARRPGFKLRPRVRSDVQVEQEVPLLELAAGLGAFLARKPATLDGVMSIRTPRGERHIPLLLRAGM